MKPYEVRSLSARNQMCLPYPYLKAINAGPYASFKVRLNKSKKQIILEFLGV